MSESAEVKAGGMNASLRVIIIDDESTNIAKVLGISEEREDQLEEIISKIYHVEDSTITDNFVEVSKHCRHANELAFCCFHIGAHAGKSRTLNKLNQDGGLGGMLLEALKAARNMTEGKSSEGPTESND
jgi:hypothetical protein